MVETKSSSFPESEVRYEIWEGDRLDYVFPAHMKREDAYQYWHKQNSVYHNRDFTFVEVLLHRTDGNAPTTKEG